MNNFCIKCGNKLFENDKFCTKCGFALKNIKYPPVKIISFNVAGISFDDKQEMIEDMVKEAIEQEIFIPYNGMTNREIIEFGYDVCQTDNVYLDNVRLNLTKYEGKDAIEIYAEHLVNDEEIMLGYVPKKNIKEVLDILEKVNNNYKIKINALLVGGKYKIIEVDEYTDKESIEIEELNYGVEITIYLYDR